MIITSISKTLDETDRIIISKLTEGKTGKEIARDLLIKPHSVTAKVREMKKYYECDSVAQLIFKLNNLEA